ncbi:MAG: DUF4294 domain-containing protein [Bacteroidales bacterium]|jgi:hypothetical protein|nr:DUF4294 domain-containing protein [Bacteroidales bacterium]
MNFSRHILTVAYLFLSMSAVAQRFSAEKEGHVVGMTVINGDTVYLVALKEVEIRAARLFKSKSDERAFWRLVHNVKKTYPYAKLAAVKLRQLNEHYLQLRTDKERKNYAKQVEKELTEEFEGELRKLTLSQGRILLRLVDRETGNTTYAILKEFRGSLSAFFWQSVARLFGSNLKSQYDPSYGEDKTIEQIIREIEAGYL